MSNVKLKLEMITGENLRDLGLGAVSLDLIKSMIHKRKKHKLNFIRIKNVLLCEGPCKEDEKTSCRLENGYEAGI